MINQSVKILVLSIYNEGPFNYYLKFISLENYVFTINLRNILIFKNRLYF